MHEKEKGVKNDAVPDNDNDAQLKVVFNTILGYLSLDISSSNFPVYGTTTGSAGDPNGLFVQLPLTASMETSASLDKYIMNL